MILLVVLKSAKTLIHCQCVHSSILLYGASQKTKFATSTICKGCLHTKQHPSVQGCCSPAVTQPESKKMQSAASPSYTLQMFVCPRICDLNHISTLTVSRQHTQLWNSSRGCLEISFPLVIFKLRLS